MRCVSVNVLPEPAPADTSSGPSTRITLSRWPDVQESRFTA